MVEKILRATKKGQPESKETIISTKPINFEIVKEWAEQAGYDRFRISELSRTSQKRSLIKPNIMDTKFDRLHFIIHKNNHQLTDEEIQQCLQFAEDTHNTIGELKWLIDNYLTQQGREEIKQVASDLKE
jgi:hypothetical protein